MRINLFVWWIGSEVSVMVQSHILQLRSGESRVGPSLSPGPNVWSHDHHLCTLVLGQVASLLTYSRFLTHYFSMLLFVCGDLVVEKRLMVYKTCRLDFLTSRFLEQPNLVKSPVGLSLGSDVGFRHLDFYHSPDLIFVISTLRTNLDANSCHLNFLQHEI